MSHIYEHIYERFRIVDADDSSVADKFADYAQWLESPGCLFQRNNFVLSSQIRTEGIIKAGLFLTVVLEGSGCGGPRKGANRFRYTNNTIVVMALREPTPCGGDAPRGAHMRAVSIAFPSSSLDRLGLRSEFLDLFGAHDRLAFVASLKASPRIQAIAMEMLSPMIEGRTGQLLLSAHATEILARAMFALRAREGIGPVTDKKRIRLQAVGDLIKADLRHPWTIAELARHAGLGRRTFNAQFHRMYGTSASDYLRTSRLASAREALLHQGLSVTEAAYGAGYASPANFSTAFRKHFGVVPSSCHRDKLS